MRASSILAEMISCLVTCEDSGFPGLFIDLDPLSFLSPGPLCRVSEEPGLHSTS